LALIGYLIGQNKTRQPRAGWREKEALVVFIG
jgi:hypothetical protein